MHIQRRVLLIASLFLIPILAAYVQWSIFGLPQLPAIPHVLPTTAEPQGFPAWLCAAHWINLLFMTLLIRSGLQILMDHPRLYWNVHCTPGTEWVRFTPVKVPMDRLWTAKDDSRYLSPWIGLPGGRHTIGLCRHWHFISVLFWVLNGLIYVILLFVTGQWARLVPTSWHIFTDAWIYFVQYATFHLPKEPDSFYHFNALQQLSYFAVVFIMAPLSIVTGPAMSPALVNRFKWYPRLFGNRQAARSIHFLMLCGYLAFIVVHVTLIAVTGLVQNMNHIVMGTNDNSLIALYIGIAILAAVVVVHVFANWFSRTQPRALQHIVEALVNPVLSVTFDRFAPQAEYTKADISPFFWPNGKSPDSDEWKVLANEGFKNYRLKVYGLVENPVALSLDELRTLGKKEQITLHNCIQGWSGVAAWGGLPMVELMKLVRPKPEAKAVVFYSFGEGLEGGQFYDSHTIENVRHCQTMLAYEMNFELLNLVHGAPLRLRVENQLGFKMVKWIKSIEFVDSVRPIFQGEGGYNEDHEFFGSMADI